MQIKKIRIDEYGSLKDRELVLDNGINVIEGNNESGKSTILSFIRFMLYGMPRKSASAVTERDRGISWGGGVAGGSMELAITDKNGVLCEYRIERHGQLRGATGHENYNEVTKIIDLATGTEVFEGQEPGKVLLGLSQETFVSTSCIRQLECTAVDGVGVNASIENLLFAANEGINTEKATDKLDELRRSLLHKNEKGGLIFELESQKLLLQEKLDRAKEQAETIIAKESAVEDAAALEADLGAKLRESENDIQLYEACAILLRFDNLHEREKQLRELNDRIAALQAEKGYQGELPTRETVSSVEALLRRLSDTATSATLREAELAKCQSSPVGNRNLASFAEIIEREGGEKAILSRFHFYQGQQKKKKAVGLLALIPGILTSILGALGAVFGVSLLTSAISIPFMTDMAKNILLPLFSGNATVFTAVFGAVFAIGIAALISGITLSASSKKAALAARKTAQRVGYSVSPATGDELEAHMYACAKEKSRCEEHDRAINAATKQAEKSNADLDTCLALCRQTLSSFAVACDSHQIDHVTARIRETIASLADLCLQKERLENEKNNLSVMISSLREGLKDYTENTLRSFIGNTVPSELVEKTDIEKLQLSKRYQKEQFATATSKRIMLEKELIALTAAAENPAKLSSRLDEICAQLEEKKFQYQSLLMAKEAIATASDTLRRSVTPRIREKAGLFMNLITDGKYSELGVSADMSVNIFAGNSTRNIDLMSKGTRDAAYLSLRMALADIVSPSTPLPLTMDEGLSLLDETRAVRVLTVLNEYAKNGGQCILFTCHKREGELMKAIGPFRHIALS